MSQAQIAQNILFTGTYLNAITPLWASEATGAAIGPDIQVSTLQTNANGVILLNATGTVSALHAASVAFQKTSDQSEIASDISMMANVPNGGGTSVENISILNNTKTYYDPLSVGNLNVYGITNTVINPQGSCGIIGQFGTSTDMEITTTGLHTSSFYTSSINGASYPPTGLGPDLLVSTINVNEAGFIRFNASGTSTLFSGGALFFQKSPDIPQTFSQSIKMAPNNLGNILPVETVENISVTHVDTVKSPPGIYYDTLALGNLLVYGVNNPKASTIGQVALFQEFSTTTDVECVTTGFHTDNLIVSSINGLPPGGGGGGPNLLVSTVQVNNAGYISMLGNTGSTAPIHFYKPIDPGAPTDLKMNTVLSKINNVSTISDILSVTSLSTTNNFTSFATGNLYVYPQDQSVLSTVGQVGIFNQWGATTDLQCVTTGFHTSSIYASSIQINSASISSLYVSSIVDYIVTVSTINATTISTTTATAPLFNASTISFQPNAGGVKVDLGLGAFAGSFAGQFAGEVTTMTIAGAALTTGVIGLSLPRTQNNIYPPGQPSTFQAINTQTQLQYSTLGTQVSTFYRFVSSSDGSMGTITPGKEYIISSIIAPGTQCIRSFSDPINLANASTFTSTVQSFGYWIPVPPSATASTILGNFNATSTLTAYTINASTSITALGTVTGANVISGGVVTAATNITAGGNVSGVNGLFSGLEQNYGLQVNGAATVTGTLGANIVNASITNTNFLSTTTINSAQTYANTFISTPTANVGNLKISTINGLPYTPGGGGGTLGLFSTLIVSSLATVSSLTTTGVENTNSLIVNSNAIIASTFTNSISSFNVNAQNITGNVGSFGSPTPTQITNTGIYNPIGQITYGQGLISSIKTNNLSTGVATVNALTLSSINGQVYPPAFNSTIIGNFNVTSSLNAHDIESATTILAQGNITSATGNMVAVNATFDQATILGPITATNATIGGITIGPGGIEVATQISASNVTISTINGAAYPPAIAFASTILGNFNVTSTLTAYKINVSTSVNCGVINSSGITNSGTITNSFGITTGSLTSLNTVNTPSLTVTTTAAIPVITGLTTVNGLPYPPVSGISSFQQLYTSSFQTSTINCANLATVSTLNTGNIVCSGNVSASAGNLLINGITASANINGLSATLGGVNIGLPAGSVSGSAAAFNSGIFVSSSVSSFFVSSINNAPYPPTVGAVSTFSTLFVSSLATVGSLASGGSITAPTAILGGVNIGPAGLVSGALITAPQMNTTTLNVTGIANLSTVSVTGNIYAPSGTLSIISSCVIGGNLSTIGNLAVGGGITLNTLSTTGSAYIGSNLKVNGTINTPYNLVVSTGTYGYVDIEATGVYAGNSNNTLTATLTPTLIQCINNTTNEQTAITNNSVTINGVSSIAFTTIGPNSINMVSSLTSQYNRTSIGNGYLTTNNINTNQNSILFTTGSPINSYTYSGVDPIFPPLGLAPITYSAYMTSYHNYGASVSFTSGTPYIIPNLVLGVNQAMFLTLFVNSRGNTGGNRSQMAGSYHITAFLDDAGPGPSYLLSYTININTIFQKNMTIQSILTTPGSYQLVIEGTVGGNPPTDVSVSWIAQPLIPYA